MGEMRYRARSAGDSEQELDHSISDHHVFGLDRNRDEEEIERKIGECEGETEQDAVDRSRGPDGAE